MVIIRRFCPLWIRKEISRLRRTRDMTIWSRNRSSNWESCSNEKARIRRWGWPEIGSCQGIIIPSANRRIRRRWNWPWRSPIASWMWIKILDEYLTISRNIMKKKALKEWRDNSWKNWPKFHLVCEKFQNRSVSKHWKISWRQKPRSVVLWRDFP